MARDRSKDLGMEFTAQVYREVAEEHVSALPSLYNAGLYALSIYVSGLAVEAMFRAYRVRIDPQFDSRHDLYELEKASQFADIVPPSQRQLYAMAFAAVATRWSNNHRYRSDAAMRAYFRRNKLNRGIKGDFLKENARRIISGATELATIGKTQWKN
jgi:hypothetical protein